MRPFGNIWRTSAAILIVLLVAFLFRAWILRELIANAASNASGTSVSFASMRLGWDTSSFTDVTVVARNGQPLATIPSLTIGYDLRDALPGGARRYGLRAIDIESPHITIVHNVDGSYNFPGVRESSGAAGSGPPFVFVARVRNGTIELSDDSRRNPAARRLYAGALSLDADVDTAAKSRYSAHGSYREDGRSYPVAARGSIDAARGTMMQRVSASHIPIARLANYAANSSAVRLTSGDLADVDVRYFGLAGDDNIVHPHLTGSLTLRDVSADLSGLSKPVTIAGGRFDVTDDGLTTEHAGVRLGNVAATVSGGIYDFAHPTLRVALGARATLEDVRDVVTAARRLAITGRVVASGIAGGDIAQPTAFISLGAPRIAYNDVPLDRVRAVVGVDSGELDIAASHVRANGIDVSATGRVAFARETNAIRLLLAGDAPAERIPYGAGVVPGMTIRAAVLATATDPANIQTRGFVHGEMERQILSAPFDVDSLGVGTVGPIFIGNARSSLYGRVAIDHVRGTTSGVAVATNFHVAASEPVAFPPFRFDALPPIDGTLDATAAAAQDGSELGALGVAAARDADVGPVRVDRANATFGGALGAIALDSFDARGPWGAGRGAATVLTASDRIAIQVRDATFSPASDALPAIASANATIGTHGNAIDVYAARAIVAGGIVRANGSFGNGGTVSLAATNLDLAALHGMRIPRSAGRANVAATLAGDASHPELNGEFVLAGGNVGTLAVGGAGVVAFAGDRLNVSASTIRVGAATADVRGSVAGLHVTGTVDPRYDMRAIVRGVDLHQVAAFARPQFARQVSGSGDADVRVAGTANHPTVVGSLSVPVGSILGESFRNFATHVDASTGSAALESGNVSLGSTAIAFAGSVSSESGAFRIRAARMDLADLNDFFDAGDTLAGRGKFAGALAARAGSLTTAGDATFSGVRFRQYPIGDAQARWSTSGRTVYIAANAGSDSGRVRVDGTAVIPQYGAVDLAQSIAPRSTLNLTADARSVDLAAWLPLFGVTAPVAGIVDADATIRGRYPALSVAATGSVAHGTIGRVPVDALTASVHLAGTRATIDALDTRVSNLFAHASGTFGLRPGDAFDVTTHATSPNVGTLATVVTGKPQDIAGALDTTLRLTGTVAKPALTDDVTMTSLRYGTFAIPRAVGTISANTRRVALRAGEVDFERGTLLVAGAIPLSRKGEPIDIRTAPIAATLTANDVELASFANLLPKGTKVGGRIDGTITAGGTVSAPQLGGTVALANGAFSGPLDSAPITQASASVALEGTTVTLQALHANVGGGSLDAHGTASVPSFYDAQNAAFDVTASATAIVVDSPQYYNGRVDATLTAKRAAHAKALVSGDLTASNARVPISALYNPGASSSPAPHPLDVGFDLGVHVGRNVRVQNGSVDIGATGNATLGGTLAAPTLDGRFTSTGGTLSFYRNFRIQEGHVTFDAANGVTPNVDAVATTSVDNPPTDITIHVTGPATALNVVFASDPTYDRTQILGLLVGVQQFGALQGVNSAGGSTFSAGSAIQNVAVAQANQLFTRNLLEPLSTGLGSSLGLSNLDIYDDVGGGFGASAVKRIGRRITASTSQNFSIPRKSSVKIRYRRSATTDYQLTVFQQQATPYGLGPLAQLPSVGAQTLGIAPTDVQPAGGDSGFTLSFEKRF